jgi:hypothetical protein
MQKALLIQPNTPSQPLYNMSSAQSMSGRATILFYPNSSRTFSSPPSLVHSSPSKHSPAALTLSHNQPAPLALVIPTSAPQISISTSTNNMSSCTTIVVPGTRNSHHHFHPLLYYGDTQSIIVMGAAVQPPQARHCVDPAPAIPPAPSRIYNMGLPPVPVNQIVPAQPEPLLPDIFSHPASQMDTSDGKVELVPQPGKFYYSLRSMTDTEEIKLQLAQP